MPRREVCIKTKIWRK